jgi:hypothetical protein
MQNEKMVELANRLALTKDTLEWKLVPYSWSHKGNMIRGKHGHCVGSGIYSTFFPDAEPQKFMTLPNVSLEPLGITYNDVILIVAAGDDWRNEFDGENVLKLRKLFLEAIGLPDDTGVTDV